MTMSIYRANRVALLIALPIGRDDFMRRIPRSDWLSKYAFDGEAAEIATMLDDVWTCEHEPMVAEPLRELVRYARGRGVQVIERATLDHVRWASDACCLIIVLAHWKAHELPDQDILARTDESILLERARRSESDVARFVRERLEEVQAVPNKLSWKGVKSLFRKKEYSEPKYRVLREALDLKECCTVNAQDQAVLRISENTRKALRRATLDEIFKGLIRPGNRIELYDGLHSREAFEAAICSTFDGLFDLTTCTSTLLADYISGARARKVRLVQFPEQQQAIWHAYCIEVALSLMLDEGFDYQKARLLASAMLERTLQERSQQKL
ncbi:hypothetical protein WL13_00510 [Burkholderia ubonensis]|uniref:hypothetical protein n=2 Tax=Burkholderia ubonensis TaxID=101571 RepID=UPI00075C8B6A|nr:hypothetical protein [Burkholderia ubonensis]KVU09055.1 hypothetical protein WK60_20125 [Burkholderia ubonensis]KVZ18093.1 hypothetical protein WL13_00510 [Burkholderia ubonensis]KWE96935.1 hypothetical protein WL82_24895 [Burkholderia ubonensis]KWO71391.1 hypothetical protein WM31_13360 [Burkholderia ubonensis]